MEVKVFKIGGNVIDNPEALDSFLGEFARVEGLDAHNHSIQVRAARVNR